MSTKIEDIPLQTESPELRVSEEDENFLRIDVGHSETEAEIDIDDLPKIMADLSLPLNDRISSMNLYHSKHGSEVYETINNLGTMYEMSGIKVLREYLYNICEKSTVSVVAKSLAAKFLYSRNEADDLAYKAINIIYPLLDDSVGTPYKIDLIKILMNSDNFREQSKDHFCSTINDQKIDCHYRYKTILGLESKIRNEDDEKEQLAKIEKNKKVHYFVTEACIAFLRETKNLKIYRLLSAQNLLASPETNSEYKDESQAFLLSLAKDTDVEYNLRADASDILLQYGDNKYKKDARDIIRLLGVGNRNKFTVYDNAQNVHTKEIENSVLQAIEFLQTFTVKKGLTILKIEKQILKKATKGKAKIRVAFNRIIVDRAIYSKYSCTLSNILLKIWTYMSGHKAKEEMIKRLIEELIEMAGTCSSGYVTRLVNSISGFGDFSIRISYEDQMVGNLNGRLNDRIKDIDDLTLQEKVLAEMTLESSSFEERKHFLQFLRENISEIREELYAEFKPLITDADFDLYFRKALSVYEGN